MYDYKKCGEMEIIEPKEMPESTEIVLMEILRFERGLTVAELKRVLADWPDTNEEGEPTEVWVCNGAGLSNQVSEVWPLRMREAADGTKRADLLLQHAGA